MAARKRTRKRKVVRSDVEETDWHSDRGHLRRGEEARLHARTPSPRHHRRAPLAASRRQGALDGHPVAEDRRLGEDER